MNEQIEKQAIEEMANDLMICHVEFGEDDDIRTDYDATATMLYRDKGYRKQSIGEWMQDFDGDYYCPFCAHYPKEIINFCPDCGAKMKGGAE